MLLFHLPAELFTAVVGLLPPADAVRLRRVSKAWQTALSAPEICRALLRLHFPRCRELRLDDEEEANTNWAVAWATAARRYHNLCRGRPHRIDTFDSLARVNSHNRWPPPVFHGLPPAPINFCLSFHPEIKACEWEPLWSYSADDAMLVYLEALPPPQLTDLHIPCYPLRLLDVEARTHTVVPFDVSRSTVRRIRLAHSLLAVEWIDRVPHPGVANHYVTLYDVRRLPSCFSPSIALRTTLDLFGGSPCPIACHDCYYSTHSATHYAVYACLGAHGVTEWMWVWQLPPPPAPESWSDTLPAPACQHVLSLSDQQLVCYLSDYHLHSYRFRPGLHSLVLDDHNLYILQEVKKGTARGAFRPLRVVSLPVIPFGPLGRPCRPMGPPGAASSLRLVPPRLIGPEWQAFCTDSTCEGACRTWCAVVHPEDHRRRNRRGARPPDRPPLPEPREPPPLPPQSCLQAWRWPQKSVESARNKAAKDRGDHKNHKDQHRESPPKLPPHSLMPGYWPYNECPMDVEAEVVDTHAGVHFAALQYGGLRWPDMALPVLRIGLMAGTCDSTMAAYQEETGSWEEEDLEGGFGGGSGSSTISSFSFRSGGIEEEHQWSALARSWGGRLEHQLLRCLAGGLFPQGLEENDIVCGPAALAGDERWLIGQDQAGRISIVSF